LPHIKLQQSWIFSPLIADFPLMRRTIAHVFVYLRESLSIEPNEWTSAFAFFGTSLDGEVAWLLGHKWEAFSL